MIRNTLYRFLGLMAACLPLTAAASDGAGDPAAYRDGDRLFVRLPLEPGIDLRANEQLILRPVVVNGELQEVLPALVYTGRIRQKVNLRRERLYGTPAVPEDTFDNVVVRHAKQAAEQSVLYEGDIPYQPWMAGGRVMVYREMEGCAGSRWSLAPLVAARIAAPVRPQLSFLIPAEEDVKRRSEQITAVVHFPQGRSVLLRGFGDNRRQLARIDSLTARLTGSDSLRVDSIFLKGYASPEDTYAFNTRLSANRARSIRNYLRDKYGISESAFTLANVPEDWDSLRRWVVVSDLPARDDVLAVIDTVPDPDTRDAAIWRIDGGRTYLKLLHDVYPQLRRVDYRIGYTLPAYTLAESREVVYTHPEWLGVGELCRLAASYPPDSPERAYVCAVAVEYYPYDACACNNMAMLALCRGDVQTARMYLSRCADDVRVQNNLGVLCLVEGDQERAGYCFAVAAENGSSEAVYNLAHWGELDPQF